MACRSTVSFDLIHKIFRILLLLSKQALCYNNLTAQAKAELSMPERTLNHPVRQGKPAELFESACFEGMIE